MQTIVKFKRNRQTVIVDALHAKRVDRTFTVTTQPYRLGLAEYRVHSGFMA